MTGITPVAKKTVKDLAPKHHSALAPSKRAAFTLTEVLITLGIIGVVAAMTLTPIVANYKERVLFNQVKTAYSELQNAIQLYAVKNSCDGIGCISDTTQTTEELANKLFAQFQGAYKCSDRRWDPRSKRICKSADMGSDALTPNFVSARGVAYQVLQYSSCPTQYPGYTSNTCALFYFDANGTNRGPNKFGADIYRFDLEVDGVLKDRYKLMEYVLTKSKVRY